MLMTRYLRLTIAAAIALLAAADVSAQGAPAAAQPTAPDSAAVAAIVNRARQAAGTDWSVTADFMCTVDGGRGNRPDDPLIAPTRVFDNLYAIGRTSTVVWAITTTEGIMLIDSGYADQIDTVLLPGMRALGLDPNDVEYVLLGHGHGDHFGGAPYFQARGARVVLSAADWDLIENPPPPPVGGPAPAPVPPPKRDVVAVEGQPITLGDVSVTPVLIPGHTPGALGFVFQVKDGTTTHTAALFGGSILTPGRISDAGLEQYVSSVEHFAEVTRANSVDVEIQNHPLYDGFTTKLERLAARAPGQRHPFVVGADGYQRFLTVMAECTRAQRERRRGAP
jgi:metallo-beta-lactamase class B